MGLAHGVRASARMLPGRTAEERLHESAVRWSPKGGDAAAEPGRWAYRSGTALENAGVCGMAITIDLPALGESVVEGTISRWLVVEGDSVEVDQPLVEVTTDKVDAEIPSPAAGVVVKLLVAEGDVVEVGAKLAEIDPDARPAAAAPGASAEPAAPAAPGRTSGRRGPTRAAGAGPSPRRRRSGTRPLDRRHRRSTPRRHRR